MLYYKRDRAREKFITIFLYNSKYDINYLQYNTEYAATYIQPFE